MWTEKLRIVSRCSLCRCGETGFTRHHDRLRRRHRLQKKAPFTRSSEGPTQGRVGHESTASPGSRSILRTCAKMVQNQTLDWMEPDGLYAHHDVWFARSWSGTRYLLSLPRKTQGMDSASCVVAFSSLGNRRFLLWV